jgi:hypothetical protein
MTQASAELSLALGRLHREIEHALSGNAYYQAAQHLRELGEAAGVAISVSQDEAHAGLGAALGGLRATVEASLSGNAYYIAAGKLDAIAAIAQQAGVSLASTAEVIASPGEPMAETGDAQAARTFDDIAAASKARLDEVSAALGTVSHAAASLNAPEELDQAPGAAPEDALSAVGLPDPVAPEPHATAVADPSPYITIEHTQQAETLADGELERRSSEPCDMPAVEVERMDPVEAAGVSADPVPDADNAKPQADLGPQDAATGSAVGDAQPERKAPAPEEAGTAPAPHPAAPAHDPAPAPAGQTVEAAASAAAAASAPSREVVQRTQKSLFMLWLDIVFGRKRDERGN